ncbi:MAG TPA: hypothetical protein VF221_17525 [Chloroflexota bacterium]
MNRRSTVQIVLFLGLASSAAGFVLQLAEDILGAEPGLRWVSVFVASLVGGFDVGRRGSGVVAILQAGR